MRSQPAQRLRQAIGNPFGFRISDFGLRTLNWSSRAVTLVPTGRELSAGRSAFELRDVKLNREALMRTPLDVELVQERLGCDFWFQSEAHGAEAKLHLRRRTDSDNTIWLIALAKEQLALIADNRFHVISFR